MLIQQVYKLFHRLEADKMSLFYRGIVRDEITDKLIWLSDENIRNQTASALERIRKRVSFAISECFQNIIRHGELASPGEQEKASMFMVRNLANAYYIGSVNLMHNKNVNKLREQLEALNELSAEELRSMYIQLLPVAQFSEKGGAGLGLIEMARKSRKKFKFDFLLVSHYLSLFFMQLSFYESSIKNIGENEGVDIEEVKGLYRLLEEQNIMLLYRSDFSQDGMLPLMDMMENNISKASGATFGQRKLLYVLVELFQNIVKHAEARAGRQEGILMITEHNGSYEVYTGNFIRNVDILALEHHLMKLISLNKAELQAFYKQELILGQGTSKGGAGLGLIETARYCNGGFTFKFSPVNTEISFFSLGIKL